MASAATPDMQHLTAAGRRLEYYWTAPHDGDSPALVFLHEGLGSAGLWRDFPAQLTAETGLPALVYSRYGYGGSDVLAGPRNVDYMHVEAQEALKLRAVHCSPSKRLRRRLPSFRSCAPRDCNQCEVCAEPMI